MFMTVAGILAFRNDAVGFSAGMLCHWSFLLEDYWSERDHDAVGRLGWRRDSHGMKVHNTKMRIMIVEITLSFHQHTLWYLQFGRGRPLGMLQST